MNFQILSPYKIAFDGEAESVLVHGEAGVFQVLNGHAPILAVLIPGDVKVIADGKELHFLASHGVLEFNHNRGVILAEAVERPGEIDVERARRARENAEKQLAELTEKFQINRYEKSLMRAISREKFQEEFPG
jgi:F-type H+-transporting ATPase subunit epsilon